MQWSARSTLAWAVVALVLVQLTLRFTIDHLRPELRDPTFEIKAARLSAVVAAHSSPPLTLVMTGSSVTSNAFKAKHLEDLLADELHCDTVAFNMGCHGGGPLTQLLWIRRMLDRDIRLDFVALEFSPHLCCDGADGPVDASRFPNHILTRHDLKAIRPFVHRDVESVREWRRHRWVPTYYHRLTILNCVATPLVPVRDRLPTWGGTIDERCWTELAERSKEERESNIRGVKNMYAPQLMNLTPGKSSVHALEQAVELLAARSIPTAVVLIPQGPEFRRLYAPAKLNALVAEVKSLTKKHRGTFVDAFDWLQEDQFTDCIHPTAAGAEVFTTRLRREVILPALANRL